MPNPGPSGHGTGVDLEFLKALAQIIGIDLVLAGDNAVIIALAARRLPPELQRRAVVFGALAAVVFRVGLTLIVVTLLSIPLLMLAGGLVLLVIAWRLATSEREAATPEAPTTLREAVLTILVADVVMSLDNVLAVAGAAAGAAHSQYLLVMIGLLVSIPIVMGGSTVLLGLLRRWPGISLIGAALIAYTAIDLLLADPWVALTADLSHLGAETVAICGTLAFMCFVMARQRYCRKKSVLMIEGTVTDE